MTELELVELGALVAFTLVTATWVGCAVVLVVQVETARHTEHHKGTAEHDSGALEENDEHGIVDPSGRVTVTPGEPGEQDER